MYKRLFLLISFVLVLGLVSTNVVFGDVIEVRVAAGEDDSEEHLATGAIDLTSSDLEITEEGSPENNQLVGMRFNNIDIPQGAIITSAYVQFHVDEIEVPGDNRPGTKFLRGEAVDNAATFSDTAFDIASRPTTSAEASWDWPFWLTEHEEGPDQRTSDIAAVIQELVDRPGWSPGNSLALIITGSGENCAEAFEGEADGAPLLHVEFGEAAGPAVGQPTGKILIEYWNGIGGTVLSDLYNNARFPDAPDDSGYLTAFDLPYDPPYGDNYGARIRGYLYPPETGDYNFWIAGDDACEFLLSTDDDPANVIRIAWIDGWCDPYDWDNATGSNNPDQASAAPVTLQAGQKYYIEGGLKEGGGGDGIAVAWQGPGIADRAVIAGDYLSAWLLLNARGPIPADGTIDADVMMLEWTAGDTAVSHKVYLSTDATVDESDFLAETQMALQFADLVPGTAYYWRVDEVQADGTVIEGAVWSFTTLPLEAHFPSPEDGARNIESGVKLSWTGGKGVIMHDVYFGTDEAAVAASDPSTFKGKVMATSFDPGALELFTTYYWKIDEFAVTGTNAGPVWSFSTPEYVVIDSGETTLNYDNSVEPYVSEAVWDTPADLTFGGVSVLSLRFHGGAGQEGSVSLDEATGTYSMTGSGADVWGNSDQFHYGYRELTGDGEIVARVVSNGTGTNNWAKGGVMIRETLDANSKHTIMALTGGEGGGITFQGRPETGGSSRSYHGDLTAAPPYWVKLTRVGNTITAYSSADGVEWTLFTDASPDGAITNPWDIEMADPVLIGLFVTSHQAGERRTYTFDNVSVAGNISDTDMSTDIGIPFNTPEPIYVALEDTTGAVATVVHPYAEATMINAWRDWTIPLSEFAGVDASSAAKLYFGVGDGEPGGHGTVRIANIRVIKPAGANIIWVSDGYDDNADGASDDLPWVDLLEAQGHTVDYQIITIGNGYWRELDDAKIAALNAADLVIISRCTDSGNYNNGDEGTQWNSITTPMLNFSTHLIRSSRWRWLDTTTLPTISDAVVEFLAPDNPIFAGVESPAWVGDGLVGPSSYADITGVGAGNGTLLAKVADVDVACIVVWEAGVEFYPGSGQIAGGPRMFFVAGTQEDAATGVGRGEMNLTPDGVTIFLNAVNMMLPVKLSDVTVPSDIVQGVPNDGDWPGAETPPLAIDDKVNTKYLHFKGDFNPDPGTGGAGFQVTPLDGATIVTGLTFTTANDAAPRDPVAFELSGSNDSIDGPYTLIASGDIVDFAQADAWPRFTKNETPISFENDVVYKHYQIIFTAIRDAPNANSMQIAEVELLGVPAPAGPAGYAYDGGALDDTWNHDNGSDAWDGTGPGEGNPGGAASLTEDGVTFLRIQDTGDPRDYGMPDPSNRKVYLTHPIDIGLDGTRLEFCARVATSAPLDDKHPDGGAGIEPWPAGSAGYHIRDNGKGMIGISDGVGIISFSLAKAGETGFEDVTTDVLVMNNLVGTEPSGNVDTGDAAVATNMIALWNTFDATQWNTFVIDIAAGGAGTHIVSLSVNGGLAESFEVTTGTGLEGSSPYIAIGSSGTGPFTAFDVDYISVSE